VKPPPAPRRRSVHLTDDDVAALITATPANYRALIITLAGLGLRIRPLSKSVAGHLFDKLTAETGVEASPHSLRHYFGSSLISGGTSVVAVSRWLGHSSPEITFRVYSYMTRNDEAAGRAAMTATMGRVTSVVSIPRPSGSSSVL
jgi:integrase